MSSVDFHPIELALWRRVWRDIGRMARRGEIVGCRPGRLTVDHETNVAEFTDGDRVVARYRFTPTPNRYRLIEIEQIEGGKLSRPPEATVRGSTTESLR